MLAQSTIAAMVDKLLNYKSKRELAAELKVQAKTIDALKALTGRAATDPKVHLRLIKLYCKMEADV